MKTLFAFLSMMLILLTLPNTALGAGAPKKYSNNIPKNSIETLINGLNSNNKGVIIGCAMMAGDYKVIEAVEHLAKILNSDWSYDVKTAAVFALYQIQTEDALLALKKVCLKNQCPFLKQAAAVFLNHYCIYHPDEDIRIEEDFIVAE